MQLHRPVIFHEMQSNVFHVSFQLKTVTTICEKNVNFFFADDHKNLKTFFYNRQISNYSLMATCNFYA